jgi:hypothetical protein
MKREKLSHSAIALIASILVIGGTGYTFYKYQRTSVIARLTDENHQIKRIVQSGPEKEALKTPYLAELMGLSADRPTPYDLFNTKDAEKKLQTAPVIKWAKVHKKKPDAVYVEYEARHPIVTIGDFANTAMDEDKMLFPLRPYYTPKRLPEFYLGTSDFHSPIQGEPVDLALEILSLCDGLFFPARLDVSNAFHESLGRREIVLILNTPRGDKHTLRLSPANAKEQLGNYHQLRLLPGDKTIDLRLGQLGFIQD